MLMGIGSFRKFIGLVGLLFVFQVFLIACGENPTSTVVPAATIAPTTAPVATTAAIVPTATPAPTSASVPTATAAPTATLIPATVAPTVTAAPTATVAPTASPVPPSATPIPPTSTPVPPTPTPLPPTAIPAPAFNSKGIGLDKATWESVHGSSTNGLTYENNKYFVLFRAGKVGNLTRQYGKNPVSKTDMQAEAKTLMPGDSKLVKSFTVPATGASAELYFSDAIKKQFGNDINWTGGEPGNFIVIYKSAEFIMAPGNNP